MGTALVGARALIDDDLVRVERAAIIIDGERIAAAGAQDSIEIPRDAQLLELEGNTLLPGFIDTHVHIRLAEARLVVQRGVTTVRDLGWPVEQIMPLARRSRAADFDGPGILAAGPILTAPGGYPTQAAWAPPGTGREVDDDPAGIVEEIADAGADVIKIALNPPAGPVLDGPTLGAIIDAAHARSLKVTGHVYGLQELQKAIECGIDELAHALMSAERIPAALTGEMVARGIRVVPTLSVRFGDQQIAIENVRAFIEAGGEVVYGTDLGNDGPQPGIDSREVRAMAAAGMSALDIVRSATVRASRWLGLEGAGALSAGSDADLIVVGGDATTNVDALCDVQMVWRRGRRLR